MISFTLTRGAHINGGIEGVFRMDLGGFQCSSLENENLCIPEGVYSLTVYDSPHAGHPVPLLQGVPDRTEIEIHCGNYPCDSKGCILVGETVDIEGMLQESRLTFDRLFPLIDSAVERGVPVTLRVVSETA